MHIIYVSELDGDQLVNFYWIDPVMVAERSAGKSKYAGKLYLKFEAEDSWTRPGVCAFGCINSQIECLPRATDSCCFFIIWPAERFQR